MTAIAVTIAGSDSGGGAGIQADLKTFSALGVYGASVITALTAQNTKGVTGIHDVPPDFIAAQIDAVFSDLDVECGEDRHAVARRAIAAVAAGLDRHKATNVVLDPVMVATSGDRLLKPDAVEQTSPSADPKRAGADAQPSGGRGAARYVDRGGRSRMRDQAQRLLASRRQVGADQGRPRQRRRKRRSSGRAERRRAARRAALRHPQHPRHRLHAVVGDRRGIGEGHEPHRGRARGQEPTSPTAIAAADRLSIGSDRFEPRPGPSFSSLVVSTTLQRQFRSEQ